MPGNMKKILARISIILRRTVFPSAFICIILLLSFLIRIQDVERIPEGQFTGADPYLYAKQSEQIVKLGYLPARDMDRWVPFGRDNRQLFPLYPYVLAYTYKTIGPLFPKLTLYHIHLYSPPVFFTFGLVALSLFLPTHLGSCLYRDCCDAFSSDAGKHQSKPRGV